MEIIILKSADSVAAMAGELVAELLRVRPAAVLGLATGIWLKNTWMGIFRSGTQQASTWTSTWVLPLKTRKATGPI